MFVNNNQASTKIFPPRELFSDANLCDVVWYVCYYYLLLTMN